MSTDDLYPTGPKPSGKIEVKLNDNATRGQLPEELTWGTRLVVNGEEMTATVRAKCADCGSHEIDHHLTLEDNYNPTPEDNFPENDAWHSPYIKHSTHCRKCEIDRKAARALEDPRDKRTGRLGGLE